MNDIRTAPFVAEMIRTTTSMYAHGWAQHGIYGAGKDLDETFGLIETAEKAAEVYLKIAHLPWKQTLTDDNLRAIADRFGVTPREGFLG